MKYTLISSKGQITIPKDMQKQLGIGHRSKIALYPQNGTLVIKPQKTSIVEQTAGSLAHLVPADKKNTSWDEIMKITKQKAAKKIAQKGT